MIYYMIYICNYIYLTYMHIYIIYVGKRAKKFFQKVKNFSKILPDEIFENHIENLYRPIFVFSEIRYN